MRKNISAAIAATFLTFIVPGYIVTMAVLTPSVIAGVMFAALMAAAGVLAWHMAYTAFRDSR